MDKKSAYYDCYRTETQWEARLRLLRDGEVNWAAPRKKKKSDAKITILQPLELSKWSSNYFTSNNTV